MPALRTWSASPGRRPAAPTRIGTPTACDRLGDQRVGVGVGERVDVGGVLRPDHQVAAWRPGRPRRPRPACRVASTWLSRTARRWPRKSRPSRGTLPCTSGHRDACRPAWSASAPRSRRTARRDRQRQAAGQHRHRAPAGLDGAQPPQPRARRRPAARRTAPRAKVTSGAPAERGQRGERRSRCWRTPAGPTGSRRTAPGRGPTPGRPTGRPPTAASRAAGRSARVPAPIGTKKHASISDRPTTASQPTVCSHCSSQRKNGSANTKPVHARLAAPGGPG